VVSVTDPYCRILGFLDRSRYFSIKKLLSCTHAGFSIRKGKDGEEKEARKCGE
jgi:hypothetical protein